MGFDRKREQAQGVLLVWAIVLTTIAAAVFVALAIQHVWAFSDFSL